MKIIFSKYLFICVILTIFISAFFLLTNNFITYAEIEEEIIVSVKEEIVQVNEITAEEIIVLEKIYGTINEEYLINENEQENLKNNQNKITQKDEIAQENKVTQETEITQKNETLKTDEKIQQEEKVVEEKVREVEEKIKIDYSLLSPGESEKDKFISEINYENFSAKKVIRAAVGKRELWFKNNENNNWTKIAGEEIFAENSRVYFKNNNVFWIGKNNETLWRFNIGTNAYESISVSAGEGAVLYFTNEASEPRAFEMNPIGKVNFF